MLTETAAKGIQPGLNSQRDPELFIPQAKDFSNYVNPEDAAATYHAIIGTIRESLMNGANALYLAAYQCDVILQKADKRIEANNKIIREEIEQFGVVYITQN